MKKLKTNIIVLVGLCLLSLSTVNAQINLPKNNSIKNVELKKNSIEDLKFSVAPIDGIIGELIDGRYQIYWTKNNGVVCCFKTVKEAVNLFPKKNLKYVTGGRYGFVFAETANGDIGNKIADAHIAFRKQNSTITHYAHTSKAGHYRIALLPGKYIVSLKHKGYSNYTTYPGFSVVYNKFSTFNIPIKKL